MGWEGEGLEFLDGGWMNIAEAWMGTRIAMVLMNWLGWLRWRFDRSISTVEPVPVSAGRREGREKRGWMVSLGLSDDRTALDLDWLACASGALFFSSFSLRVPESTSERGWMM
jgi:hypothetical protein